MQAHLIDFLKNICQHGLCLYLKSEFVHVKLGQPSLAPAHERGRPLRPHTGQRQLHPTLHRPDRGQDGSQVTILDQNGELF